MTLLSILHYVIRPVFGDFETEELKKFARMGLIFSLIIGTFWTIGTLRNALFLTYVGIAHLPYAKTLSLLLLVPAIIMYTKLLDIYGREKVFYLFSIIAGFTVFLFGFLFSITQNTLYSVQDGWLTLVPMVIGY